MVATLNRTVVPVRQESTLGLVNKWMKFDAGSVILLRITASFACLRRHPE